MFRVQRALPLQHEGRNTSRVLVSRRWAPRPIYDDSGLHASCVQEGGSKIKVHRTLSRWSSETHNGLTIDLFGLTFFRIYMPNVFDSRKVYSCTGQSQE